MTFRMPNPLPSSGTASDSLPGVGHHHGGDPRVSRQRSAIAERSRWDLMLIALAGMLLAYIWRLQSLYPILAAIQFPSLVAAAAAVVFLLDKDRRRSLRSIRHPVVTAAGLIFVIMLLSAPAGLYAGQSVSFIKNDYLKTLLLMVLLAAGIRTFEDVERMVRILVLGAMLYSWYILTRFTVGMSGRLGNLVYYDANDLAFLIVCTIPLGVYFFSRKVPGRMKWVAAFGLLLFIMAIVKSGSRGGFLGLIAVGLYLLFGFGAVSKQTRLLTVIGSVGLMLVFGSAKYWEMMATLLNPQEDYNWANDEGRGRTEIWKRGLGYMMAHPLLGVGARNFPVAEGTISAKAQDEVYGRGVQRRAAHNSFVELGAELGVIALGLFIFMLGHAYRSARGIGGRGPGPPTREKAMGHALAGSLVGYVTAGFFVSQAYSAFLYAILAIIVGLAKVTSTAGTPASNPAALRQPLARALRGAPLPRRFAARH